MLLSAGRPYGAMLLPMAQEDPGSTCVSVAWDWVFQGVSEAGHREELGYALSCAKANRVAEAGSLAPVETCVLQVRGGRWWERGRGVGQ